MGQKFVAHPLLCVLSVSLFSLGCLAGCGGSSPSGGSTSTAPSGVIPQIVGQPTNVTVPLGAQGTFTVTATGSGTLSYQWSKNSVAIANSNSATYTTPAVTAADSGSVFTVAITDSLGTVISNSATLTVGARAPKTGDLRFQQVDSANTINGYTAKTAANVQIGTPVSYTNSTGTPLELVAGQCNQAPPPASCSWQYATFNQPTSVTTSLTTGYASDAYTSLQTDIGSGFQGMPSLMSPNVVVTSLSLAPADNLYAVSYMQTTQTGTFDLAQHTISPSQIQSSATTEGLAGRVITALSLEPPSLVYFSYGWTGDTGTIYEAEAVTATFGTASTVASSLASQGYIITAIGSDPTDPNSEIVMVGTRVQGDTTPRPILVLPFASDPTPILTGGYAIVGTVLTTTNGTDSGVWICER